MQEQFSFLTKEKLTAAQKDVFTQDMSFILMTGPDVSIEMSQLRSLASHQSADLHLVPFVDRAAPLVTESWLLERGIAVDLLNVSEQVQFRPIMFDKWQKSLKIWANYDKEITKVSRNYVDSWFGNMEKIWLLFLRNYSTDIKRKFFWEDFKSVWCVLWISVTLMVRSPEADTIYLSSKSTTFTAARCPTRTRRRLMSVGEAMSQTAMERSLEQVTIRPFAKRRWRTASLWWISVFSTSPVVTSQTLQKRRVTGWRSSKNRT